MIPIIILHKQVVQIMSDVFHEIFFFWKRFPRSFSAFYFHGNVCHRNGIFRNLIRTWNSKIDVAEEEFSPFWESDKNISWKNKDLIFINLSIIWYKCDPRQVDELESQFFTNYFTDDIVRKLTKFTHIYAAHNNIAYFVK